MVYEIVAVRGHYAMYINSRFYCSADTLEEATMEIEMHRNQHCYAEV